MRSQGQTANRLRSSSFLSGDIQMDAIPVVGEGGKGQLLLSAHFPRLPPSLLWPAWSLGSLSTWQRIAEQFWQGQGPGHPLSAPERAWVSAENTPPCLCRGAWFAWPVPSAAVPCWGRQAGLWWGWLLQDVGTRLCANTASVAEGNQARPRQDFCQLGIS